MRRENQLSGKIMRVCVFGLRGFPNIEGGVESHSERLYPLIGQDASEIIVFRRRSYVHSNQSYPGIKFVDLPSTRIKGFETVLHSLLATLYSLVLAPDVVHIHNIGAALFAPLLKLRGIAVVLTFHSANYEHKKWGAFARRFLLLCESVALKSADRIIFVNRFQMQKYAEQIQKKSVYIPNGIGQPVVPHSVGYLDELGLEPGKYILTVGRITPEKGFHTLIEAYTHSTIKDYPLVIAGSAGTEKGYFNQLQQLKGESTVLFSGYVCGEKLAQLYANAALFVLASENEGFPLVLLEAMSYGRDVLVSDIPGTRLVDLHPEDYFPVNNCVALKEKLEKKLTCPQNREYDLSAFDWQKIAETVSGIFEEVASDKNEKQGVI